MRFADALKERRLLFDGGLGSMLYRKGMLRSDVPEMMNITRPEWVRDIHRAYAQAGARVVTTNSLGANAVALKRHGLEGRLEELTEAAVCLVREGTEGEAMIALSVGPTGDMLAPLGMMSWQEAYLSYTRQAVAGQQAGADVVYIETMGDLAEARIAALAALENTDLPVCVSFVYKDGATLMGNSPECAALVGQGIGLAAIATNCSGEPEEMAKTLARTRAVSALPFIAMPNAGLPKVEDGVAVYDLTPKDMAPRMRALLEGGASGIGGCCGTTPEHIEAFAGELVPFQAPPEPPSIAMQYLCSARRFLPLEEARNALREIPADLDAVYELDGPSLIDLTDTSDVTSFLMEACAATAHILCFRVADDAQAQEALRLYPGIAGVVGPASGETLRRYGAIALG